MGNGATAHGSRVGNDLPPGNKKRANHAGRVRPKRKASRVDLPEVAKPGLPGIVATTAFAIEKLAELAEFSPRLRSEYEVITEQDAEKSVDYLRDSARRAAKARAEYGYLDAFTKVVKAKLMREHAGKEPLGAQEAIALSHAQYQAHLSAVATAAEAFEYERFMREAASAKFEAWRTQQANERAGRP